MTSDQDRQLLLRLARQAIAAHIGPLHHSAIESAIESPIESPIESAIDSPIDSPIDSAIRNPQSAILARPAGAFVTLHKRGALRGCIGHIEPTEPIGTVVPSCAIAACSSDPRFPPVALAELDDIDIEISLLGPLEPIAGPQDIVIGRHGLLVERGWKRGLLLPQVATEWKWDADAFLAHTCEKAALPRDAWQRGAKVWRFEAEVFGEGGEGG